MHPFPDALRPENVIDESDRKSTPGGEPERLRRVPNEKKKSNRGDEHKRCSDAGNKGRNRGNRSPEKTVRNSKKHEANPRQYSLYKRDGEIPFDDRVNRGLEPFKDPFV